jgi:hypothetical protein
MSAGRHSFKLNDTARLVRATTAAGLKVKAVTMRDGKPYVEIDNGNAAADKPNAWDEILPADQQRKLKHEQD